ncbi:phosphoribosylanthranilate isomerase [Simiduia agarivorans]|uniref:N-(5'-phosphoribosyl)anthranilate isomerase n=1 Tax=Simiduia agarivorans (strain DSM 21679 / JCM 13881 / BCRC 17597 / SA1) TaxID=1117647 RepID=K4KE86_SIMAS|nr:phosphoribosylanthranilate isomerase [Simiduia agarivorans]AFU97354.1 N-(5'phosphoribosyl)anthranilate isomerase [Simiduia agarivorans SA1 = DSM 21679]
MYPNSRTRIKVCGLTQPDNALAVEACGVDAIGLVFYAASKRAVTPEQAAKIGEVLGPLTHRVGLFVDPEPALVEAVLSTGHITSLQFHGDEPEAFCRRFGVPYFKALRMRPGLDCEQAIAAYPSASGFLLDAFQPGQPGGTGERFDWSRVPSHCGRPLILAGGLNPDNVAQAIRQTNVYGVDLSGGVESAPGVKDVARVRALVAAVAAADAARSG